MTQRIGIITFPGSLDERDAARAVTLGGGEAVPLWHDDPLLHGVDAVIIPGGFSYGDYLRCGAISSFSPVMESVVDAARNGMPVLGICNGFQILCESHLLPGALTRNDNQRFGCRDQELIVETNETSWTAAYVPGQAITIPLKNGEGRFTASKRTLDELEAEGRVVVRYSGTNPNGSARNIAGVCNEEGNVVGLMPHPEHAVESGVGPDGVLGPRTGVDGQGFFDSILQRVYAR